MTLPMERLSLKWSMVDTDLPLEQAFAMLVEAGFDGVELDAPTDLPLEQVRAARDATGLALPGVINAGHWKTPLTDPDPAVRQAGFDGVRAAIDTAQAIGAETVLLVPGLVDAGTGYRAAWDRGLEQVAALAPHARDAGVTIGLENVWNDFLLSPLESLRFLEELNSPHFGWYLDIGNLLKNANPVDWIQILGKRIIRVDLKEYSLERMNNTGPWSGFDVELGEGDCDWHSINNALRDTGYRGWASAEVPGGGPERLAEIRRRMDNVRRM